MYKIYTKHNHCRKYGETVYNPQSPAVTAPANRGGGLWHCIKLCKSPFPHRLHHYAKGAPTRGAGAKRLRGRQCTEIADREKKEQGIEYMCHSPKGTRRQINESWYAAVALSEATWESVSLCSSSMFSCGVRGRGLPRPVCAPVVAMTSWFGSSASIFHALRTVENGIRFCPVSRKPCSSNH